MPFATILGSMIGGALATAFLWFSMKLQGGFSEDGWYFLYIMPIISSAVFGWLYATIVCHVAPRGKVIAGTVMVTILGLIGVVGALITWLDQTKSVGEAIQITVGTVATMLSLIHISEPTRPY